MPRTHGVRRLRWRHLRRASSASSDHLPVPPAAPAAPAALAHRGQARVLAAGAIERPIVFGGNDRPGVMLASARAHLRQPLRRRAWRRGRGVHHQRRRLAYRRRSRRGRRRGRGGHRSARRGRPMPWCAGRQSAGARLLLGATVVDADGGARGCAGIDVAERRHEPSIAADTLAVSGGWNPNVGARLASGRASPTGRERHRGLRAGRPAADGMTVAGAANGALFAGRAACATGAAAGSEAAAPTWASQPRPDRCPAPIDEPSRRAAPLWHVAGSRRKGLRRSAERRHGQGRRACAPRGLPLRRASQALHHARHGDRSGQDLERQRPRHHGRTHRPHDRRRPARRSSRPPYTPVAIGALAGHHRGKHFQADAPAPPAMPGREEQGAVFVEAGLGCARSGFRSRARPTGWRASPAR